MHKDLKDFKPKTLDEAIKIIENLKTYLKKLKEEERVTIKYLNFCRKHNFNHEADWLANEVRLLGQQYIRIHNEVFGVYF